MVYTTNNTKETKTKNSIKKGRKKSNKKSLKSLRSIRNKKLNNSLKYTLEKTALINSFLQKMHPSFILPAYKNYGTHSEKNNDTPHNLSKLSVLLNLIDKTFYGTLGFGFFEKEHNTCGFSSNPDNSSNSVFSNMAYYLDKFHEELLEFEINDQLEMYNFIFLQVLINTNKMRFCSLYKLCIRNRKNQNFFIKFPIPLYFLIDYESNDGLLKGNSSMSVFNILLKKLSYEPSFKFDIGEYLDAEIRSKKGNGLCEYCYSFFREFKVSRRLILSLIASINDKNLLVSSSRSKILGKKSFISRSFIDDVNDDLNDGGKGEITKGSVKAENNEEEELSFNDNKSYLNNKSYINKDVQILLNVLFSIYHKLSNTDPRDYKNCNNINTSAILGAIYMFKKYYNNVIKYCGYYGYNKNDNIKEFSDLRKKADMCQKYKNTLLKTVNIFLNMLLDLKNNNAELCETTIPSNLPHYVFTSVRCSTKDVVYNSSLLSRELIKQLKNIYLHSCNYWRLFQKSY